MTNNIGSIYMPKDFNFENIMRLRLQNRKLEDIICYDTGIFVDVNKVYGKIVITDDCIVVYNEAVKSFSTAVHYKEVVKINRINDRPKFIYGRMRRNCVHFQVHTNRHIPKDKTNKKLIRNPLCWTESAKNKSKDALQSSTNSSIDQTNEDTQFNLTLTHSDLPKGEVMDFYVLNNRSCMVILLNFAFTDYLIRETLSFSHSNSRLELNTSSDDFQRIFNELVSDVIGSKDNSSHLRDVLLELIQAGLKYTHIRNSFWLKSELYTFIMEQVLDRANFLFSVFDVKEDSDDDSDDNDTRKTTAPLELVNSCLDTINVQLELLGVFFAETDHLHSKYFQIRKQDGKLAKSVLKSLFRVIALLNKQDEFSVSDNSEIDVEIDLNKYYLTINAVRVIYYLIRASNVPFIVDDRDSFTTGHVVRIIESLSSYDCRRGVFNRFLNQVLQMIFIWIFPDAFKLSTQQKLEPRQIVMIFQFFISIQSISICIPKIMGILKMEMKEEFEHFVVQKLSFSEMYPLTIPTLDLLRTIQMNMMLDNDIFVQTKI